MKEIQLTQGQVALVDDEDFEALSQSKWWANKDRNTFYAYRWIKVDGKGIAQSMHNAILNGKGIDHIDKNGLNNQKSNLRFCTISENAMNQRKQRNTSSIYKGVCIDKPYGKWRSHIRINGKAIDLGSFTSEVEAAKAYNAKAIELFGEFANLNNFN